MRGGETREENKRRHDDATIRINDQGAPRSWLLTRDSESPGFKAIRRDKFGLTGLPGKQALECVAQDLTCEYIYVPTRNLCLLPRIDPTALQPRDPRVEVETQGNGNI